MCTLVMCRVCMVVQSSHVYCVECVYGSADRVAMSGSRVLLSRGSSTSSLIERTRLTYL